MATPSSIAAWVGHAATAGAKLAAQRHVGEHKPVCVWSHVSGDQRRLFSLPPVVLLRVFDCLWELLGFS